MKELIDFDGLFERKLAAYMKENAGKYTEEEWEERIPKLYRKFGKTYIKSVQNTPEGYYAEMSDEELLKTLLAHAREKVPMSDFLLREIEERKPKGLFELAKSKEKELIRLAFDLSETPDLDEVAFSLLDEEEEIKERALEHLKEHADRVLERALSLFEKGEKREEILEILSRCQRRDERVLSALLTAFRTSFESRPIYADYLAAYGDERALPFLLEEIKREEIGFLEYRELKFAIEALGGEAEEREFPSDPDYLAVEASSARETLEREK